MSEQFYTVTIFAVIGLFLALLCINFYFRLKVLKIYQRLRREGVEFDASHFFNGDKLKTEVLGKYPESSTDISKFIYLVKLSITMASILIILIIVAGSALMFYR